MDKYMVIGVENDAERPDGYYILDTDTGEFVMGMWNSRGPAEIAAGEMMGIHVIRWERLKQSSAQITELRELLSELQYVNTLDDALSYVLIWYNKHKKEPPSRRHDHPGGHIIQKG
jgi:hypothetical protein